MWRFAVLALGLALAGGSRMWAGGTGESPPGPESGENHSLAMEYWATQPDDPEIRLKANKPLKPAAPNDDIDTRIAIDPSTRYQSMDGFGASMTDSAAFVISSLSGSERTALMERLFDPEHGLGISFLRQPMGSPDFARSIRSYNDQAPGKVDPEQKDFSIRGDQEYIIPLLKEALRINPGITIMASPWSPPGWMKTGASMLGASGGVLKPEYYQSYALYFVKFIQAYQAEGIPVHLLSSQNEPAYGPADYPGMVWSADEEGLFVSKYLGPALKAAGLSTKILGWDHNWDKQTHARTLLGSPETAPWFAGTAWHWYGGSPRAMTEIHESFPEHGIWFTEGGSGRWIGGDTFTGQFKDGIQKAIWICQNWSKSLVWWNIALDSQNGPIVFTNTANYGLVEIDTNRRELKKPYHAGWYTLGHFSKFVKPGAWRIGHSFDNQDINAVAFENPDGSIIVVLANPYSSDQTARITLGSSGWNVDVPGDGAVTCRLFKTNPPRRNS